MIRFSRIDGVLRSHDSELTNNKRSLFRPGHCSPAVHGASCSLRADRAPGHRGRRETAGRPSL